MKTYPHVVMGIAPVADAFAGTANTDVFSMRNYKTAIAYVIVGVGATGTSTITVTACDDTTPTNETAIPFLYQQTATGDTAGAITQATTAGYTTTAGSNKIIKIFIDASDIGATGYEFCRVNFVEVANSPVLGGVMIELVDPRYDEDIQPTAIV